VRGIPDDLVCGGQRRTGAEVAAYGRVCFWVAVQVILCLAALLIIDSSSPFAGIPSVRETTAAPASDAQQHFGAGARFLDHPAEQAGD